MPLTQSNLAGRTYAELVEEARNLIPGLASDWTNHNPTDPGIALIELFAWLTEMVLYRVERVPSANYEKFLQLLKGDSSWRLPSDAVSRAEALEAEIRTTVLGLRKRYRAVTTEDYTQLILEDWLEAPPNEILNRIFDMKKLEEKSDQHQMGHGLAVNDLDKDGVEKLIVGIGHTVKPYLQHKFNLTTAAQIREALSVDAKNIKRVICVPERDLEDRANAGEVAAGHLSVIVITDNQTDQAPIDDLIRRHTPSDALRALLWVYLDERRLVTTRHHVVKPDFLQVTIEANLHLQEDALWVTVRPNADEGLFNFFNPLSGGPEDNGWPLGRAVYESEVYQRLEQIPGVDYVTNVKIRPNTPPGEHQLVAVTPILADGSAS